MNAYWRAANYLSVGQIYLLDNPLLRTPLKIEHVKPRLLGHWGTTPGLNLIYAHLNRVIKRRNLSVLYVTGPGHGGPGMVANAYLEGRYTEVYSSMTQDEDGMRRLFRQFSFPGGIPSHDSPERPGSIHEGGELGYALSHAFGAAFDDPDLIVACVIGDGEAETGPLATGWHGNKFLNPVTDGAVLPILHLNGYKIANPTILARIPKEELASLLVGYGYRPYFVEGSDPEEVHQLMAATLDTVIDEIHAIQNDARNTGFHGRPRWPAIVLNTPKGWTGPKEVDGKPAEGNYRSHQVPFAAVRTNHDHLKLLEQWMHSYRPEELFDAEGRLVAELRDLPPKGALRMSANPVTNGGEVLSGLRLPAFTDYAVEVPGPGVTYSEACRVLGVFLRDIVARNPSNFRIFGPDETASNRLGAVFDVTNRAWTADIYPSDDGLAPEGRVVEVLSEHQCQGWLEGYLLTGRHGFFSCYEAFIHIIDSMFNQHAKWLKTTNAIPWRQPIASLNYLLTSHVWRQDHNGFSHQDPGFIDHVVNKKASVVRVYLPPDANTLLSTADHCLRSRQYVNVIVAGKQPALNYLTMDEAILHCTRGLGIWKWASNDPGRLPGRRHGVRRGRPHTGDPGRGRDDPRTSARAEGAGHQCCGPDAAAGRAGAPARHAGQGFRRAVHPGPADHIRLPRIPLADSPAHLPAEQPSAHSRPRVQGGGHHHHAFRHGHDERPGPVPPRHGRHRPGSGARSRGPRTCASTWSTNGCAPASTPATPARTCPKSPTGNGRTEPEPASVTSKATSPVR